MTSLSLRWRLTVSQPELSLSRVLRCSQVPSPEEQGLRLSQGELDLE